MGSSPVRLVRSTAKGIGARISRIFVDDDKQRRPYVAGLAEAYARGWDGCPCVFVLSTGRVGTQTLAALLDLSLDISASHEPEPRLIRASFEAFTEGDRQTADDRWSAIVLAARDDLICDANSRGQIYVETNNRLTFLAPTLAKVFPASKFIHLHRHPYEVIRSAMQRRFYQGNGWDFARIRPRAGDPVAAKWSTLSAIEKCAWYWATIDGESQAFLQRLPESRRLNLPARDLFAGDMGVIQHLFEFIGAQAPTSKSVATVLSRQLNAETRNSFSSADGWSESDRAAVNRLVAPTATRLGYTL